MNRKILEDRLIDFAVLNAEILSKMPNNKFANNLANQLAKCSTSPALNYGETQSAASRKDFIFRMSIVLKELRETLICLTIIQRSGSCQSEDILEKVIKECNELVSIFYRSLETAAKRNL